MEENISNADKLNCRVEEKDKTEIKIRKLPKTSIALFAICGASLLIYLIASISEPFANFFNRYVSSVIRAALAFLTNVFPFSLAEAMLLFLPVIIAIAVTAAVKKYADCLKNTLIYILVLLSAASLFLSVFLCGFAVGYRNSPLDEKLGIDRRDVSAEELRDTAMILASSANLEAEGIKFRSDGFSVMPYTLDEMNDRLLKAYDKICDKYGFVQRLKSKVKPVVLSEPWSYTHVTGVYTYYTGEANINVNFPDYTLPFTAAHELSHQRGIAREDEANFMAFLVCIESDDPYIRYSGYLGMYEYVSNSLYGANREMYGETRGKLTKNVKREMAAYSEFFSKYRKNPVAKVSEKINDAYLKIQGTEGTKSYGMVTDLAVAYYRNK